MVQTHTATHWPGGTARITFRTGAEPLAWAARIPERAVPKMDVPSLTDLGARHLAHGGRRFVARFTVQVTAGFALFALACQRGNLILAFVSTWVLYGSCLTTVHHLVHSRLGLSARARHAGLTIFGCLVLESGHALRLTHLAHHQTSLDSPDPEGYIESVPWRRMPFEMWRFRYRLMGWGLRFGTDRRVRAEVGVHIVAHLGAIAVLPLTWWPLAYVSAIGLASGAFAVMAGKGPQTNYGRPVHTPLVRVKARATRCRLFSHDRHLEHHAYPSVPLAWLRKLEHNGHSPIDDLATLDVRIP